MRYLFYIECGSLDALDEIFDAGLSNNTIEKYAALTVDGAPILYEQGSDSAVEYLNAMGLSCCGITEQKG